MLVFGIVSGSRISSGVCEGGRVVREGAVSKVRTLLMITSSDKPYSIVRIRLIYSHTNRLHVYF